MNLDLDKLREANLERSLEWMGELPSEKDLAFCALELGGETGEALNKIKKLLRSKLGIAGGSDDLQPIIDELADVIICVDRVAAALSVNLSAAVQVKFNQTSRKHGFKTML